MKKTGRSIWTKLMVPILIIMLLQAIWFVATVLFGGVSKELKRKDLNILRENTENVKLYTEQEMIRRWIGTLDNGDVISHQIEQILRREGRKAEEIHTDPDLNRLILQEVMDHAIVLLHRSSGNGFYLILDGPASKNNNEDMRAGIYVRDMDSSSYAADHSDLLLERGMPSISKNFRIPLDMFWELGFELEDNGGAEYFFRPFEAAVTHGALLEDTDSYGYLSMPMKFHDLDTSVISYSVPLIIGKDTLIGVMGIDKSVEQVSRMINTEKFATSQNGITILGKRMKGSNKIEVATSNGPLYSRYFQNDFIELPEDKGLDTTTGYLTDRDGNTWAASVSPLSLYSTNTPFESEEWVVVGLSESSNVLASYHQIRRLLSLILVASFGFGVVALFFIGTTITRPINNLVKDLRHTKRQDKVQLKRVHINEIDELISAIELLSQNVAENSSKISNILEVAKVPIGVFEYSKGEESVFCSRSLYKMMGWEVPLDSYTYMELKEFKDRMQVLPDFVLEETDGTNKLFHLEGSEEKWLDLKIVRSEADSILGALSDVTQEQLKQKRLEWESKYDSLTEIYNRRAFKEKANEILKQKSGSLIACIMLDLDNLKYVNDTYGHEKGDLYIRTFAKTLQSFERQGALICRYSGDEFMVLIHNGTKEEIRHQIEGFMDQLKQISIQVGNGYYLPLRASAGISWYPEHAEDLNLLSTYADFAMYIAKHSVKGIAVEFKPEDYNKNSYMLSGLEELNQIIENKTVSFAMQPIVTRDGTIYGYEFLMRPDLKFLKDMGEVLNLAKNQAKLNQLEDLTWLAALKQIDEQVQMGNLAGDEKFFINSISSVGLSEMVESALENEYADYQHRLVIEITEEEQLDADCLEKKLKAATIWNCMVAVDDLGSGYNGETVLIDIKPDIAKLDMKLIRNIHEDEDRQQMVKYLLSYLNANEIMVLAEGVENIEELQYLMDLGIELFQGYYIGRPELEIRPLNPFIVEKMRMLSNRRG